MDLSPPAARKLLHVRTVECRGYAREDGLWDIEGALKDVKTYPFENRWRGLVLAGDPVHEMTIRLTLDDRLYIKKAEAFTRNSPFEVCPSAAWAFTRLEGLRIKGGWMKLVKERYGRAQGCTHLLEMLYPVATTAFQTIFAYREQMMREEGLTEAEAMRRKGPPANSCYAFAEDGPVMRRIRAEASAEAAE
ncbi:MAG: DUF2889 domain-containing protein [Alphaproteobacteria bacterium]